MQAPVAFNKFCGYFFQDIGLVKPNPEAWISFAARHLSETEKAVVKDYLSELLNGSHNDAELQQIWFNSGAEISFPDNNHLRGFLALARNTIQN